MARLCFTAADSLPQAPFKQLRGATQMARYY